MSTRTLSLQTAILAALVTTSAVAQPPRPAIQPLPNRIRLDVVVTPKSGSPVVGLQAQDFTVLDNHVAQKIESFQPIGSTRDPIEVILLIDAVNSTVRNVAYQRQQIDKFLQENQGHLAHPISIAVLTDTGTELAQGFSTDGNAISDALDHETIGLREIRRNSGFWGADDRIDISLQGLQLLTTKMAQLPGRKIILWISPGWPYLSGPEVDLDRKQQQQIYSQVVQLSTSLRQDNITLYSVDPLGAEEGVGWEFYYEQFLKGLSKPSQAQLGNLSLQVLAIQSGGLALNASNDIAGHLDRCMKELDNYYELTFTPPPAEHPGEYHQLDIKLNQPGLKAHTRAGYYSQP